MPIFIFLILCFVFLIIFYRPIQVKSETDELTPMSIGESCKHVSVAELDQWFQSKKWNEIPKIIHQTWKTATLRERQARWSQTWCDQYSGWRYHLWTDEENDLFVRTKFPWFYPTFEKLSPAILRVDSVRYLYMLHYGGLYVRKIEKEILIGNSVCLLKLFRLI